MKIKKILSLALAAMLTASCCIPAGAVWKEYKPYGGFDGR